MASRSKKILRIAAILFVTLFFTSKALAQLTMGTVDAGPYTPGSTIAATFSIGNTSCINPGNIFQLYLSDASGNFASETLIGSYSSFYGTFVNGILPAGLPAGTGYRLRIKSTNPALVSNSSIPITITTGTSVEAKLTSTYLKAGNTETFGTCSTTANKQFFIKNESTANSTVAATITNEITGAVSVLNFPTPNQSFTAQLTHYTIFTKATMPDGTVATKAYMLINNSVVTAFSTAGNNIVCLPLGSLEFTVITSGIGGIQDNFPGDSYVINWGDGTSSTYTYCDIKNAGDIIRHSYIKSSCGSVSTNSSGTVYNAFDVNIKVSNDFCGNIGTPISSYAKVVVKPTNEFTFPLTACTNKPVTFVNKSTKGEDPNTNSPGCTPNEVTYNWFVDGVPVEVNMPLSYNFVYTFTTHGEHTVRLESANSGACNAEPVEHKVCIQDPPKPAFSLPNETICAPGNLKVKDLSQIDLICNVENIYSWSVSPAVTYANVTTSSSTEPEFIFTDPGLYTIILSITSASCGSVTTAPQTLVVNKKPTAVLSPDIALCNLATYDFNNTTPGPTNTSFSGTYKELPGTYMWTVTGGPYSYANGTTSSSKYPSITFGDYVEYTITVTHVNNCGTATATQKISFNTAPVVSAGPNQSICYNDPAFNLSGSVIGSTTNVTWIGGTTANFNPSRNDLNATYTPTVAEKAAGLVTLTLRATTSLPAPCTQVSDEVILTIKPNISLTSATTKTICTGNNVNYIPTNSVTGSTFTWTAAGSANADGFSPSGTGTITDILTNTDKTNSATVTYTITPHQNGCDGTPFLFTVTVMPNPIASFTAPALPICNKTSSAITLSSNLTNTKYTYTSTVKGNLTGNSNNATASSANTINDVLINTGTTEASVVYTVTPISASGCKGIPIDITINVSPSATIAFAGADETLCNTSTHTLKGNEPIVGKGKWSVVSAPSPITFTDDTKYNTDVNGLLSGNTYTLRWTIADDSGCASTSADVKIGISASSVGGTISGASTVCAGVNSGNINLSGHVGNILRWEKSTDGNSWDIVNTTANPYVFSNLTTTTQFRAIVKSGVCAEAISTSVTITVNQPAVTANAGPGQTLCGASTVNLSGNSPATNSGLWTLVTAQRGVTITDPTLYSTSVTGLVPGQTYTFRWTISGLAPCPATSDDVTIKVDLPTAGGTTTGSATVCAGSSNGTIALSGQVGNILRWESSADGTTWTSIGRSGQTSISYSNLNSTTHYRAVVKSGICPEASSTESVVTVNQGAVAASAGNNQVLCGANAATLEGNNPLTNTGLWTLTSAQSGVTITNPTLYSTSVTGLVPGQTYTFRWTISGLAPCPATSDDVTIKVDLPTAGGTTTGSATVCAGSNSGTIALSGQVGNILRWESSADGTTWISIGRSGQTSISYSNLNSTTHYRAVVKSGICPETSSTESVVTVNQGAVAASAGNNQVLCGANAATLEGNNPLTNTGLWTLTSAQSGVTITNPAQYNTSVTGLVPGQTYIFRWTISGLEPCPETSDDVTIKVDLPTAGGTTTGSVAFCSSSNTGSILLSGHTGHIVRWESSTDGTNWTTINSTANPYAYLNLSVTTQFRAIVLNGTCTEASSAPSTITINPLTVVAVVGADQNICSGNSASLTGNDPSPNTGLWTLVSGQSGVTIVNSTSNHATATGLIPGQNYTFRWTISGFTSCDPTFAETSVNYYPTVTNTITASATPVCTGQNLTITGNTPTGGTGVYAYQWQSSIDGVTFTDLPAETNRDLSLNVVSTLYYRRLVNSSICASYSNMVQITALPSIANNTISAHQTICVGDTPAPLTGSLPTGGDGNYNYQWQSSFDGTVWVNMTSETNINLTLAAPTTTILYRRIVSSATCTGAFQNISNAVTITLNPHAKAEFTYVSDKACAPFELKATNIIAIPHPDRNAIYTWYANNVAIGTGTTFPGYTIANDNQKVTIKLVTTSSLNCNADEMSHDFSTPQKIVASYTQSTVSGCSPLAVNFINTSTSLTDATFTWTFGNGATSNQATPPAITFLSRADGRDTTYNVTLKAISACDTTFAKSTVFVPGKATSRFSPDKTIACLGSTITFTNFSPGETNTYYYDFDDGTPIIPITDKNPVPHLYNNTSVVKDYVVKLIVENSCGRDTSIVKVHIFPNNITPYFYPDGNTEGCAPFTVKFINNTQGASTFEYIYGDTGRDFSFGGAPETVTHTFTKPGTYKVILKASNGCFVAPDQEVEIKVNAQPNVGFSADKTISCDGATIKFKNTSTGNNSYVWNFGDGSRTSNLFEPTHIYAGAGSSYTVTLKAINASGCVDSLSIPNYINVAMPPKANFTVSPGNETTIPNYTFKFTDTSIGAAGSWEWSFGDGTTSKLQNPTHTYNDAGNYDVVLKVINANGCPNSTNQKIRIIGIPGYLNLPNSFMPASAKNELRTFTAKGTGIKEWHMSIFNKWGQVLWETTKLDLGAPTEGWDGTFKGKEQPQGVYYWKIEAKFLNGGDWKGMTYDSSAPKTTGLIYLIR